MISNKAKWRKKDVQIVGRGTGKLSSQVRIRYLSKKGNDVFKLVDDSEISLQGPSKASAPSQEFTRESGQINTLGWPEFKSRKN